MFTAYVDANMPDDQIAEILSEDAGWLEAQWSECIHQAEEAGKTVTGDPVYRNYSKVGPSGDGGFNYRFVFDVPISGAR